MNLKKSWESLKTSGGYKLLLFGSLVGTSKIPLLKAYCFFILSVYFKGSISSFVYDYRSCSNLTQLRNSNTDTSGEDSFTRAADRPYKYFTNTMLREQSYSSGFLGFFKDIEIE